MKTKLTVRNVDGLLPEAKDVIVWDTELTGFGLKVTPTGKKVYFLYYRNKWGQQRRPAIGVHGPMRPEAAREKARQWLAEVAVGRDPSQDVQLNREAPVVMDLCDRYLSDHAEIHKKATSIRNDRRLISSYILPALGQKKVASIVRDDIFNIHKNLNSTPYEANRFLALATKMFSLAELWKMRPNGSNPAKKIQRFEEKKRERYLEADEIGRLWSVLNSEIASAKVSKNAIAAIKLLMLTGRRLNEVLSLQWSWINFDKKILRLPDTKTGQLTVSLADVVLDILSELKRDADGSMYVITGRDKNKSLVNLQKSWHVLRGLAELEGVRIHDLRHTYASIGAGMGMSLPLLGRLLGHKQAATTSRYAHLAQDPVRIAADAIGEEFMRLARG